MRACRAVVAVVVPVLAAACGGGGTSPNGLATPTPSPGSGEALNFALAAHVDLTQMAAATVAEGASPVAARPASESAAEGSPQGGSVRALHGDEPLAVVGPAGLTGSGNWGYSSPDGRRFALTGFSAGLSIVEVTNPSAPRVVALVTGAESQWREVKTYKHWAYITTEAKTGLDIVDLADPARPRKVRTWNETFDSAHTVTIDSARGLAFVNGTKTGMHVLDLEPDPANPREVGVWTDLYVHDGYVRGDVLYASCIYQGLLVRLDVSDPARIRELGRFQTGGAFTHNSWPDRTGRYLFTTDERPNRPLEGWDLLDPAHPRKVTEYIARSGSIPHNVMVDGDRLLVSHYTDGVRLLDIADPERPRVLGYYDTFPDPLEGFAGAWGAYIFPGTDVVVASDISGGLFVLRYTGR